MEIVSRKIMESRGEEAQELREKQKELRQRQKMLAEEVNLWRDRSRSVYQQRSTEALKKFLYEILPEASDALELRMKRIIKLLETPPEELEAMQDQAPVHTAQTAAGRLIERARMSYDLRSSDPGERQRAAVQFANQSGMALNDEIVAEIEAAMDDQDPLVSEVAILAAIQLHRFRALRVADLSVAHESVKRLAAINHPSVVPTLIEILEKPRTGFIRGDEEAQEATNANSRLIALLKLVEWHTTEAQKAVQMRKFDQDKQIVQAAARALELFPGEWSGPLKRPLSK
jgi:hypothetical protein